MPRVPPGKSLPDESTQYPEGKRAARRKTPRRRNVIAGLKNLVRWKGFEPSRYCYRQPLKLVRLPVPPPPQKL